MTRDVDRMRKDKPPPTSAALRQAARERLQAVLNEHRAKAQEPPIDHLARAAAYTVESNRLLDSMKPPAQPSLRLLQGGKS